MSVLLNQRALFHDLGRAPPHLLTTFPSYLLIELQASVLMGRASVNATVSERKAPVSLEFQRLSFETILCVKEIALQDSQMLA